MSDELDIKLPEEIRQIFISLYNEFRQLNLEWNFYLQLFGNETSSILVASIARVFFEVVEESFRYDMAMAICRLSDPPKSEGHNNLCMDTLVDKCTNINGLNELRCQFKMACKPVRRLRNKIIGHSDLNIALKVEKNSMPSIGRKQIDSIIKLAGEIFNTISKSYGNTQEIIFSPLETAGGTKELLYWLDKARGQSNQ
jgi:hypothetical protein